MSEVEDFSKMLTYGYTYRHYLIQYEGWIEPRVKLQEKAYLTQINNEYAIVSVEKSLLSNDFDTDFIFNLVSEKTKILQPAFKIVSILALELYTFLETKSSGSPLSFSSRKKVPLDLKGNGVVACILGTGIDYLNEEFIDDNGKTRILEIWDQTYQGETSEVNENIPYGTIYTSDQIQNAINAHKEGKNPYEIVPIKDTRGNSTNMAGIIAGSGKHELFSGIAPECSLLIIKLHESMAIKNDYNIDIPIFNVTTLIPALEYIKNYSKKHSKPVVIHFPFGSTSGNHRGANALDVYIRKLVSNINIVLVTGSGNEGANDGHVSGIVMNRGDNTINLIVDPKQKFLFVDIWVKAPNLMSINVFSPSGEETGNIMASLNSQRSHQFTFEDTQINIKYSIPEQFTGDELIRIYFFNLKPGIWRIMLFLDLGINAEFNAWLPQRGITNEGTRFSPSEPYGTFTLPGDSPDVITVAAFDQSNMNMLKYSGLGFRDDEINRIDIVAGGSNVLTVGLNNEMVAVDGTSVSSAIVSGLCVLLFQWGIVDNNYPYMYTESIRTFLTRGTDQLQGDIYPNPWWGYGVVDFYKVFRLIN